ncbi:MAG: BrnT family toxin [Betaproteobacteria bacterium]|nr:BrnT family toxin [Betaproteobacteria bacterium]
MRFTWDEAKRKSNLAKHGLDFADASRVFAGPIALFEDPRHDYGEQRMIAVGLLDSLVVLVVHVESDETIRIISLRKADKHETNLYFQNIGAI